MSWRPVQFIRPLAIALIRRADELLVMAVKDDSGAVKGWRPPGGGIEFGESAVAALEREMLEELGQPIECGQRLWVVENIYRHEGALGHELVFVFDAAFTDPAAYATECYRFIDQAVQNEVTWRKVEGFVRGREPLFPAGLAAQLGRPDSLLNRGDRG